MPYRALDLTVATRDAMAPICRTCTWWQTRAGAATPPDRRAAWETACEAEAGFFGRILAEDGVVLGWMHAAAARLVPRAACLPAGPPSSDAYLLTCSYFHDEQDLRGFHFLLQEIEASLKHRRIAALEAFALRRPRPDGPSTGYLRELNLFHPEALEEEGFRAVQVKGDVARYRLDLGALVVATRQSRTRSVEARPGAAAAPV